MSTGVLPPPPTAMQRLRGTASSTFKFVNKYRLPIGIFTVAYLIANPELLDVRNWPYRVWLMPVMGTVEFLLPFGWLAVQLGVLTGVVIVVCLAFSQGKQLYKKFQEQRHARWHASVDQKAAAQVKQARAGAQQAHSLTAAQRVAQEQQEQEELRKARAEARAAADSPQPISATVGPAACARNADAPTQQTQADTPSSAAGDAAAAVGGAGPGPAGAAERTRWLQQLQERADAAAAAARAEKERQLAEALAAAVRATAASSGGGDAQSSDPAAVKEARRELQKHYSFAAAAAADADAAAASTTTSVATAPGSTSGSSSKPADAAAAAAAAAATRDAASSVSASVGSSSGSSSSKAARTLAAMVPREAALEAEERQRAWLQQLGAPQPSSGSQGSALPPGVAEALEADRALRAAQDAEYLESLAADRARREAAEAAARAAEEAKEAAARREQELRELRERLREGLQEEPGPNADGAVLVRVRLPDGSSHTRRFLAEVLVQVVQDWVQSLETLQAGPGEWGLATTYPRGSADPTQPLASYTEGASSMAFLVESK